MLAKQPNNNENNVGKISLNVRGVFVTTTFHTCSAACLTIRATSDLPIYKPARTLFRLSIPSDPKIAYIHNRNLNKYLITFSTTIPFLIKETRIKRLLNNSMVIFNV